MIGVTKRRRQMYTSRMDNLLLFWDFAPVLAGLGAILLFWSIWSGRARGRKRCPKCRYDMSHPSDEPLRCPECGHVAKHERRLLGIHPNWRQFSTAVVLLLAAMVWIGYPRFERNGWLAFVPDTVLLLSMTRDIDSWAAGRLTNRLGGTGDKFDPDQMWNWQWRFMAWQAGNSIQDGDINWYSSPQFQLLLGAPSPRDQRAFTYLEDLLKNRAAMNPMTTLSQMKLIASRAADPDLRRRYVDAALDLIPSDVSQIAYPELIRCLGQPWSELDAAVPLLVNILEYDVAAWDRRRWETLNALQRVGSHGRDATEAVVALLATTNPRTNERIAVLETLAAINPDDDRLHGELLRGLRQDWPAGRLVSLERNWSDPDWARFQHQLSATRLWMKLELDPAEVLPSLSEIIYADPFYFRFFRQQLTAFVHFGDDGARLLIHIIEASPSTFAEGGLRPQAHEALRDFETIPDDVRERLQREAERLERLRREAALKTLEIIGEG